MSIEKKERWRPGGVSLVGLRDIRKSRRLSIMDICTGVKCDPAHISRAERGQRTVGEPLARAIAQALGVTLEELAG